MRTLYRDAALADGTGPELRVGVSILVAGDRIAWVGDAGDEPQVADDTVVIDASGANDAMLQWSVTSDCHTARNWPGVACRSRSADGNH